MVNWRCLLPISLVVLAGLLLYWPGLRGGFIFDDFPNLVADQDWRVTALEWPQWRRAMALGISSGSGRPLALLSFGLNHYLTGLDPFWLKITGLALHLLNGALVFLLCDRVFALAAAVNPRERMGRYAATMVALAWTLHPLQVSTVLYIVQRMEVGAYTGVLIALLAYVEARSRQQRGLGSTGWWILVVFGMALGLGFKESALLLPGYTLLLEVFVLRFRGQGGKVLRNLLAFYALGLAAAAAIFMFKILPGALQPWAYEFRDFTMGQRLLTQCHVLLVYLGQILLPSPGRLVFYYDNFPISTGFLRPAATLWGLLVMIALAALAFLSRHRWPLVALGISWFFMAHVLTSNVIPLELAFEHRNYFAILGILLAVSQLLAALTSRLNMDARRALAVLPVALLAVMCALQVNTWAEPFRLSLALSTRNPGSERASYELGRAMLEASGGNQDSPLVDLAIQQWEDASKLPSRSPLAEQAMIIALSHKGRPVPAATWDRFREKLNAGIAGPQQVSALHGVVECAAKGSCKLDKEQLLQTFGVALQRNPDSATIHSLYANFAWSVMGDTQLAIDMMREASRLAPWDLQFKVNLVRFLVASGADPEELTRLRQEIRVADQAGQYLDQTL